VRRRELRRIDGSGCLHRAGGGKGEQMTAFHQRRPTWAPNGLASIILGPPDLQIAGSALGTGPEACDDRAFN
jgi:hypothetical protein